MNVFRLGIVPGTMPGIWIDRWRERERTPIEVVPVSAQEAEALVRSGELDAALLRLPVDREAAHAIELYDEVPVVVSGAETAMAALDAQEKVRASDLADEVLLVTADDVLGISPADYPGSIPAAFDAPATTAEGIAIVATGAATMIVPMSLARLHHRRDVIFRELDGGPRSSVALVWPKDGAHPQMDVFIGIVRGRTARSSR